MSDYNVNMKKFNGTDYDNILPHAYLADVATSANNAEKLGEVGKSDIITQAREGLCRIATGSYVGNGIYTSPTTFHIEAKPKLIFFYKINMVKPIYTTTMKVNRVDKTWSSFYAFCYTFTNMTDGTVYNLSNRPSPVPIAFVPDSKFLVFGNYQNTERYSDEYVSIEISYKNQNVLITQTQYESYMNRNATALYERRNAKYQFNESGVTYQWYALTETTT